jgi:16S rRNA (adenine1518-N6/adenine1519-N6)-dimethyltransferase
VPDLLNVSSPKTAREVLDKYHLSPLKRFGQNFLIDDNIIRRIAESASYGSGFVMEVGAGLGALTIKLAERSKKVLVYEIDGGLCLALEETLSGIKNVTVLHEDVLKADIEKDTTNAFGGESFFVAANLPYYITSPCIMRLLEGRLNVSGLVLMMQKEVAQKLCAKPGSGGYSAITAATSFFSEPQIICDVSRNCFYPKPDVDSALVKITTADYNAEIKDLYLRFVKGLFAMRRKTVLNNLVMHMGYSKKSANKLLELSGIEPARRAETLSKEDFIRICHAYKNNDFIL